MAKKRAADAAQKAADEVLAFFREKTGDLSNADFDAVLDLLQEDFDAMAEARTHDADHALDGD